MRSSLLILILLLLSSLPPAQAQRRLSYKPWQLTFADEFDTYSDVADMARRSVWQFAPDAFRLLVGNRYENQYYDSTQVSVRDGLLSLTAMPLDSPLVYHYQLNGADSVRLLHYKSGWISFRQDFWTRLHLGDGSQWETNRGFAYGLFEIRCKLAPGAGTFPAFWLYSGPSEIDIFEGGDEPSVTKRANSNNVQYIPKDPAQWQSSQFFYRKDSGADLTENFHTYSAAWTPERVTFFLDGKRIRTVEAAQVPTTTSPATIIANLAIFSYANPATWPSTPEGPRTAMVIDYIRVYKQRPGQAPRKLPRPGRPRQSL